jgi:hypothetical protein
MPRTRSRRGTERYRDERRAGGPRYHGDAWHDHSEPRVLEPEMEDLDALPEAQSSGEIEGMGKHGMLRTSKGRRRAAAPEQPRRQPGASRK